MFPYIFIFILLKYTDATTCFVSGNQGKTYQLSSWNKDNPTMWNQLSSDVSLTLYSSAVDNDGQWIIAAASAQIFRQPVKDDVIFIADGESNYYSVSRSACQTLSSNIGYGWDTQSSPLGRPPGCWLYEAGPTLFWNDASESTVLCSGSNICIKKFNPDALIVQHTKTGPPDRSVSKTECEDFATAQEYSWGGNSDDGNVMGCFVQPDVSTVYFNEATTDTKCGDISASKCVEKRTFLGLIGDEYPVGTKMEMDSSNTYYINSANVAEYFYQVQAGHRWFTAAYGNGVWVIAGYYGIIMWSSDGAEMWNYATKSSAWPNNKNDKHIKNIYWNEIKKLTTGQGEFLATSYGNDILKSYDGKEWWVFKEAVKVTGGSPVTSYNLNAITYGKGMYVVVGQSNFISTYIDPGDSPVESTSGDIIDIGEANCEAYARYIGAGYGLNDQNPGPGCVITSNRQEVRYNSGHCNKPPSDELNDDINSFTTYTHSVAPSISVDVHECYAYAQLNGYTLHTGQYHGWPRGCIIVYEWAGTLMYYNNIGWDNGQNCGGSNFDVGCVEKVNLLNPSCYCTGTNICIQEWQSPDWVRRVLTNRVHAGSYYGELQTIHYANGIFVAGGEGNQIITSTDGIVWNEVVRLLSGGQYFFSVNYIDNMWLMGGHGTNNDMYISTDNGVNWSTIDAYGSVNSIVCDNKPTQCMAIQETWADCCDRATFDATCEIRRRDIYAVHGCCPYRTL